MKPTYATEAHNDIPAITWEKKELIDQDEEFDTAGWIMRGYDESHREYKGVADFKHGDLVDEIYDIEKVTP